MINNLDIWKCHFSSLIFSLNHATDKKYISSAVYTNLAILYQFRRPACMISAILFRISQAMFWNSVVWMMVILELLNPKYGGPHWRNLPSNAHTIYVQHKMILQCMGYLYSAIWNIDQFFITVGFICRQYIHLTCIIYFIEKCEVHITKTTDHTEIASITIAERVIVHFFITWKLC